MAGVDRMNQYVGTYQILMPFNPFAVHDGYSRRHHFAQSVIINHN